jgi:uncharacterized membrane-anchored protein YjiN (DUF445 family)
MITRMDKEAELKRSKQIALCFLLGAAAIFVITIFSPRNVWTNGLKAVAEAAMVGALADWFAVVALFRRVPIPFVSRHTAIIPKNKDKIADNLAVFINEKFLDPTSIVGLIRKHDPAQAVSRWLSDPANADQLGRHLISVMRGLLDVTDDRRIQAFMKDAIHVFIDEADLSRSVGVLLDDLTRNGRHQELFEQTIVLIIAQLNTPTTRLYLSEQIVAWLKREYRLTQKIIPKDWLGKHGAEKLAQLVSNVLDDVVADHAHTLRTSFDELAQKLIDRLKHDPETAAKIDGIKHYLKNDQTLNVYVGNLWNTLRGRIKADLSEQDSLIQKKTANAAKWVGRTIARDTALRESLNHHLETAAWAMAPDFSEYLTRHIRDTVRSWDARDMSRQIELNIGKDLQFIRVNGTLVGGLIGLGLYLCSLIPALF